MKNNSKIKFFIYDRYSCRLDCFFAIFFFNIMHAFNILDQSYNNTNNIDNIIKIYEHLRNIDEKIFDLGIWNYFNTFNIDLLNLLNIENHPYEIYPITQMFSLLNRSNIFCITYKLKKSCKFCDISKLNNDDNLFLDPLIKVNKDNYNFYTDTLINNLLGIIYSRCPLCGYKEGIIINDKKYDDCLKIECYDFKLPLYLSFILDTEISDFIYKL